MSFHIIRKSSFFGMRLPVLAALAVGLFIDFPVIEITNNVPLKEAQAVVGRPATPRSAAGVARRTTRRTVRRHHRHRVVVGTRVTVLPVGCSKYIVGGVTYYNCDTVYYRPYYEGNEVVYVVVEEP